MQKLKEKLKVPAETKRVIADRLRKSLAFVIEGSKGEDSGSCGSLLEFELGEELDRFHHRQVFKSENCDENNVRDDDSDVTIVSNLMSKEVRPIASSAVIDAEEKRSELEFVLSQKVINLERLQRIATSGLPDGGGLRATAWKLLLGYLPDSRDSWEDVLADNRLKYAALKAELLLNPLDSKRATDGNLLSNEQEKDGNDSEVLRGHDISHGDHPLSEGKGSFWHQYFQDAEIAEQIERDVQRTHPDVKFFSGDSSFSLENRKALRNILLLFAKLNPAIHYVQGMNEVLALVYFVFRNDPREQHASQAEADSFYCFVRLMSDSIDHFYKELDNSPVGILSTLSHLTELLKTNDEKLWQHLQVTNKVNAQFYAFRWITLLLTQEFNFNSIMRIWDSLLSNPLGIQEMLLRICCAMLLCVKSRLLAGDFTENLKLLQHYPEVNIEHLLQVAKELTNPITFPTYLSV